MTQHKDFKRLVRARMSKTGESYTAARAQLVSKSASATAPARVAVSTDYAALAGMSDQAIKEKTGCTWDRWVSALDRQGAAEMSHRDIARLVGGKYKVDAWWTQTVTVGYERIKGLRARGQQRDGTYGMSKSRTFNVPVATLFDAWKDARVRARWLDGVRVRTATAPKSMRIAWTDGSIVAVGFTAKGPSKSAVAIEHAKLTDRDAAARLKRHWEERFDALDEVLAARH